MSEAERKELDGIIATLSAKDRYTLTHAFGNAAHYLKKCLVEIDRLKKERNALRAFVRTMHAILRHKSISPPMDPGVQDAMEQEAALLVAGEGGGL